MISFDHKLNYKFIGAEVCLFALRQYETRSRLFVRQYEGHIDLLHQKCPIGTEGHCSKCQLKNSIASFIGNCKLYQQETPNLSAFKGRSEYCSLIRGDGFVYEFHHDKYIMS